MYNTKIGEKQTTVSKQQCIKTLEIGLNHLEKLILNRIYFRKVRYINNNSEVELEGQNSWKLWLKIILVNAAESTLGKCCSYLWTREPWLLMLPSVRREPGLSWTHLTGYNFSAGRQQSAPVLAFFSVLLQMVISAIQY